jgi:hypothetical protein
VESVIVNSVSNPFRIEKSKGNIILLTNIKPDPWINKSVEIHYRREPLIPVNLSSNHLFFNTIANRNPDIQYVAVLTEVTDPEIWSASVAGSGQNWQIDLTPKSGFLNDTIKVSVKSSGLPVGSYKKIITISSPEGNFYPFEIEVDLAVNPNILHQNYPNPFIACTWIEYDLPEDGPVSIEIYGSGGHKITTLLNHYMTSGNYKLKWDAWSFPAGFYILKIKTKSFSETAKMVLMK